MANSARVVTAAALIMLGVFGGFIFGSDVVIKSLGFALAFGVLVDAFIVRMTLVPAVLKLLGHSAWALPALARQAPARPRPRRRQAHPHPRRKPSDRSRNRSATEPTRCPGHRGPTRKPWAGDVVAHCALRPAGDRSAPPELSKDPTPARCTLVLQVQPAAAARPQFAHDSPRIGNVVDRHDRRRLANLVRLVVGVSAACGGGLHLAEGLLVIATRERSGTRPRHWQSARAPTSRPSSPCSRLDAVCESARGPSAIPAENDHAVQRQIATAQ